MRPIKQTEVGQWIEVELELPREKARKAAQEYYARYPREGYDTHLPKWRVTKQNLIHFTMRRLKNCD